MGLPAKLYEYEHYMFYDSEDNEYYLFIYQQINNETNLWYYGNGNKEELWDFIGTRVGYVGAGIMEQFAYYSENNCSMNNYISFYRTLIENAEPIEEIFKDFNIYAFILKNQNLRHTKKDVQEKIMYAININKMKFRGEVNYSERLLYDKNIKNKKDLKEILKTMPSVNNKECYSGISLKK